MTSLYERLALDRARAHSAVLEAERREREFARRRCELAALGLDVAVLKLWRALRRNYRPEQPRVPAGQPGGGQWTEGEGASNRRIPSGEDRRLQVAGDITGFTKHGINRAIERGIKPSAILDAVTSPLAVRPRADGSTQCRGRNATVVLDPSGLVITLWPQ